MLVKWLRRAAAIARKRFRLIREQVIPGTLSPIERRQRLIEVGRSQPGLLISAEVVELPARGSGSRQSFVRPKILVLQLAHIGDFVLSLRAVRKLRDGFPGADLTLVCAPWNVNWAREARLFDHVVAFDFFPLLNRDWSGATPDLFQRFETLALDLFDIAVDLRHDVDTRPCLYRVKAKVRAGYIAPIEAGFPPLDLMLPHVELLPLSDGQEYSLHAELRLELLADAVVSAFAERGAHPVLQLVRESEMPVQRSFVILAVSAGDSIRRWPQAQFIDLGRQIVGCFGLEVVVVGGSQERTFVDVIVDGLPANKARGRVDIPLTALASLVNEADMLIGHGSGVTHLAAALGKPTICLLSGVSPLDVWRPIGPKLINLVGATPCSPCYLKREQDCPFNVTCLTSISPNRVLAEMEKLLPALRNPQHASPHC
jgi:ADP-heptose:LPS heptosyltransferase